jgi:23S rRNA pseudouridine2605 synthase
MKLIRFLAAASGLGRRRAMELLKAGRVTMGGKPVTDSTLEVNPGSDRVAVDGKPLRPLPHLYFVLYKPRGTICSTSDPEGRPTVVELLAARHRRARPVGRLDFNTTGVLLLTTDGEMAQALLKSRKVMRRYMVKLSGAVTDGNFERWRKGLVIQGRKTAGAVVHVVKRGESRARVSVILTEGWYHMIHRMAEKTGMRALKIHRTHFAGIGLGTLKPGSYRALTVDEIKKLKKKVVAVR